MDWHHRRRLRRNGLEHDLRQHELRRTLLHEKLERANAERAAAQAALVAAEAAVARAEALYKSADLECAELGHLMAFDPSIIHDLPAELLDAVFVTLSSYPDPVWPNIYGAWYSFRRAALPYRLAAVCRRWRSVALANSSIWSYVALLPDLPREEDPHMATTILHLQSHVATQLARSRSSAIDIYLDYDADSNTLQYTELLKMRENTFYLVLDHVHRWRRVKLRLPFSNAIFGQLMSDKPLPLLEDLCLFPHEESDNMDISWLSSASAFRRLSSPDAHFSFATASSAVMIVSADLPVSDSTVGGLLNTLSQVPQLEYLGLTFNGDMDVVFTSEYPVLLDALRSLKLRGGWRVFNQFLALGFIAPNLLRLNLNESELVHAESLRRFSHAFPTIVDLEVEGSWEHSNSLDSYAGASLYHFGHLKSLTISRCTIGELFFLRMVGLGKPSHGRQWPELEMLTVSLYHHRGRAPSFLDLAHAIWSLASAYRGRERAFSVALESWPSLFPSWFRRALGAFLGSSNVRLTSGGVIYDAAGESDEEEEEEAQFTDDSAESDSSGDDDEASDSSRHSEGIRVDGPDWETDVDDMDYIDSDD